MNYNDAYPSKYLKASDLDGGPVITVIEGAPLETLGSGAEAQQRLVLYLHGLKALPLNKTNAKAVAKITGTDDTDGWTGAKIEVFPSTTELRGETVDCIRIRAPKPPGSVKQTSPRRPLQRPQSKAEAAGSIVSRGDMNDDIPFAPAF